MRKGHDLHPCPFAQCPVGAKGQQAKGYHEKIRNPLKRRVVKIFNFKGCLKSSIRHTKKELFFSVPYRRF